MVFVRNVEEEWTLVGRTSGFTVQPVPEIEGAHD
jgi:hypothetical protein